MPEVSSFQGIRVTMYYNDHPPPHFHVRYGGQKAIVTIEAPALWAGYFPSSQLNLVKEWAVRNQIALNENWELARKQEKLKPISGLI